MNYIEEARKELKDRRYPNVDALTDKQIEIIIQPLFAPEDYARDGEISSHEAYNLWIKKLRLSGLNDNQVFLAKEIMG